MMLSKMNLLLLFLVFMFNLQKYQVNTQSQIGSFGIDIRSGRLSNAVPPQSRPGGSRRVPLNIDFSPTKLPMSFLGGRQIPPAASSATSNEVLFSGLSTLVKSCFRAVERIPCQGNVFAQPSRPECIRMGCCWNPLNAVQCARSTFFVVSLKENAYDQCGFPNADVPEALADPPFNDLLLSLLPRIIGGTTASQGEWPWAVMIFEKQNGIVDGQLCGGSLVSSKWVITSAHCIGTFNPSLYNVLLGSRNLVNLDSSAVIRSLDRILDHPMYNLANINFDIALLELNESVEFNAFIRPICVVESGIMIDDLTQPTFVGETCVSVGWGRTISSSGPFSPTLQELNFAINPDAMCFVDTINPLYPVSAVIPNNPKFCASAIIPNAQDTCQGDSGGPLMCQLEDGRYYLFGIISYGTMICASGFPTVFTDVADTRINNFITANIN